VIRREDAEFEFGAGGGVGRVGGRKFQVGGVLDGQNMFVGVGGIGGFHAGRLFGIALARLLRGGAGGKRAAHGGEGLRFGIRPAFEFQRGQVGLHGGENDVGTAQHRAQRVRIVDVDLKFLTQFHGLAGEGEPGGFARLAHAMQKRIEVGLLRKGEVAGFALGNFLAGDVGGHFAEGGRRLGEIIGGQPGGDFGVFLPGGDDEVAIVGDDGDGAVWFMVHNQFLVVILTVEGYKSA